MTKKDFISFQTQVTTGNFTLPVALFLWVFFALAALRGMPLANRLAAELFTVYLLIELNTAYALIRQRTTLHIVAFLMLAAAGFRLPLGAGEAWIAPLFLMSVHQMLATYESPHAPYGAFNAFLCLGIGSFLFPPMAWLAPVYLVGLYQMRALSMRSFMGGLIGLLTPWWIYYGWVYSMDEAHFTTVRLEPIFTLREMVYPALPVTTLALWGVLLLGALVSTVHYVTVSYQDKVRTRVNLSYLMFLLIILTLIAALQPVYEAVVWTMMMPLVALFVAHLFALTRTRVISYWFVILFILFLLLPVFCVWTASSLS